jgi:hypothetical protein
MIPSGIAWDCEIDVGQPIVAGPFTRCWKPAGHEIGEALIVEIAINAVDAGRSGTPIPERVAH